MSLPDQYSYDPATPNPIYNGNTMADPGGIQAAYQRLILAYQNSRPSVQLGGAPLGNSEVQNGPLVRANQAGTSLAWSRGARGHGAQPCCFPVAAKPAKFKFPAGNVSPNSKGAVSCTAQRLRVARVVIS